MTSFAIFVVLLALMIGSLATVSLINRREQKAKQTRARLTRMKLYVDDLEEMLLGIEPLLESRAIPILVNDEVIRLIEQMIEIDQHKQAQYLEASLEQAKTRSAFLHDESSREIIRTRDSDAQIAQCQRHLKEAGGLIKQLQGRGKLSADELNIFSQELSWAYLAVEVFSNVSQGHKAIVRNDQLMAHAFYRKAKQICIQSSHPDKRRTRLIKELADILSYQRADLSDDLMHESVPGFEKDKVEETIKAHLESLKENPEQALQGQANPSQ